MKIYKNTLKIRNLRLIREYTFDILRAFIVLGFITLPVSAQTVTISGTAQYEDRAFDLSGFTGAQPLLAARWCRIEVVDNSNNVLGFGETDHNGNFSFSFNVANGTQVRVRMVAQSDFWSIQIQDSSQPGNPIWSIQVLGTVAVVSPSNWNVGVLQAMVLNDPTGGGRVGNPFNLLDETINSMYFLSQWENLGLPPTIGQTVEVRWPRIGAGAGGSYYTPGTARIQMGNSACDADTTFHHEFGHLLQDFYGDSDHPGVDHVICDSNQNPALSWPEGWATFWGCNVRKYWSITDPGIYVRTNGLPGAGNLSFSYRLEDATRASGNPYCAADPSGNASEFAVQCALWDLTDEVGDNPNNPTSDDDPFDGTLSPGGTTPWLAMWDVFRNYMLHPNIPNTEDIVFDHFWDGWWLQGYMNTDSLTHAFIDTMMSWGMTRSIFVDSLAPGPGSGTSADPYPTVTTAANNSPPGTTLLITGGNYPENITWNDPLILKARTGTGNVTIGD